MSSVYIGYNHILIYGLHLYIFVFQMLKERLCFDPEFWNLLTLRTHCLELMSDKVMKAAVLNEMNEEEEEEEEKEKRSNEELINDCVDESCTQHLNSCQCKEIAFVGQDLPEERTINGKAGKCVSNNSLLKRRTWRRRLRRRKQPASDDEADLCDDPEFKYNLKSTSFGNKTAVYSLRCNHSSIENSASVKLPLNRKRESLSRCVKSQILKRKGQKKRWLQGVSRPEQTQTVKEKKVKVKGKKRGRKPLQKLELSYPENEISLTVDEPRFEEKCETEDGEQDMPHLENEQKDDQLEEINNTEKENGLEKHSDTEQPQVKTETELSKCLLSEPQATLPAVEANPELDGPTLELLDCPVELLHNYSLKSKKPESENPQPPETSAPDEVNGDTEPEPQPTEETDVSNTKVRYLCFF